MITEYLIELFQTHSNATNIFLGLVLLLVLFQWIFLGLLVPVIIAGILSLFVTIPVALMEKNNYIFTSNYILDKEKVFYYTNDITCIIFLGFVSFVTYKRMKEDKS